MAVDILSSEYTVFENVVEKKIPNMTNVKNK